MGKEVLLAEIEVRTAADVARAVCEVGQIYLNRGFSWKHAAESAAHEFCHGILDKSRLVEPATYVVRWNSDLGLMVNYIFHEEDPRKIMAVCSAPSRLGMSNHHMSPDDIIYFKLAKASLEQMLNLNTPSFVSESSPRDDQE